MGQFSIVGVGQYSTGVDTETMLTIAGDPKHLGEKIAITSVLHTWGSAMTHHPHVHMIVPGGGLSPDGSKWVSCRPKFLVPVRVLSRLFRRLFLEMLVKAHDADRLKFRGDRSALADRQAFDAWLDPMRRSEWVVDARDPFGGPKAVLAYLSRYTHRVAISNRRLIKADKNGVTFKWKDYRIEEAARYKTMTLSPHEFIRRFLMHVLPLRFHRIRPYGLLANGSRAANVARARELLGVRVRLPDPKEENKCEPGELDVSAVPCPSCGGRMIVVEAFERGCKPKYWPPPSGPQ